MTRKIIKVRNKDHLEKQILKEIKDNGPKCDLNHLDISNIDDLSYLFESLDFNGDISKWDVSKVKNMDSMFYESNFNGSLSNWDVSNVENMGYMFSYSKFNGDISKWDISNVEIISYMFYESDFNGDISNWDVSKVDTISGMFEESKFERYEDLNNWKPYSLKNINKKQNDIFNNKEKNQKVYWSSDYIDLSKEDIKNHIDKYLAEKEKELLIDKNNNSNNKLTSKKEKFKI